MADCAEVLLVRDVLYHINGYGVMLEEHLRRKLGRKGGNYKLRRCLCCW